jgi:hypothetical protein
VAILFSPTDHAFADYLSARYLDLHRKTGQQLVFVSLLDPTHDWLSDSRNRKWWDTYRTMFGYQWYSSDDQVLLRELLRLFNVAWDELPTIVASADLWEGEFVTCRTSSELFVEQLRTLTRLVEHRGAPRNDEILESLQSTVGDLAKLHHRSVQAQKRLSGFYDVLSSFTPDDRFDYLRFLRTVKEQLNVLNAALSAFRQSRTERQDEVSGERLAEQDEEKFDDAAGSLVALASVLEHALRSNSARCIPLHSEDSVAESTSLSFRKTGLQDLLDEESSIMLNTSFRIGRLLEPV